MRSFPELFASKMKEFQVTLLFFISEHLFIGARGHTLNWHEGKYFGTWLYTEAAIHMSYNDIK